MKKASTQRTVAESPVRCAIYTRKSTSEGLDSDFSSLDAQREAAEHYIRSQAALGWSALPTAYDDGGFTGGNIERPALQRLLQAIEAGLVDMVVVYKVDRLSRSLLDFSRLMERFERKGVGFVSITQHFDTSTSMGRLVLNVLLSFAQFERELISERTRDKILAARRRGKWTGGRVVLGYALDPDRGGLKLVPEEAELVRRVFDLYLRFRSVGMVSERLNSGGYTQKRYVSRKGRSGGGQRWNMNAVHAVLTNPLYTGRIRGKDGELHPAEHHPIVTVQMFEKAAENLRSRTTGRLRHSRRDDFLLSGLIRCVPCEAAMTSSFTKARGGKVYRYYRCVKEIHGGTCRTGLLPAEDVEQVVVAQLRETARRGDVSARILARLAGPEAITKDAEGERHRLAGRLTALNEEARRLLSTFTELGASGGRLLAARLGEIEADIEAVRRQLAETEVGLHRMQDDRAQAARVAQLLTTFDDVWDALVPVERRELVHLVVRHVLVDVDAGGLRIGLHDLDNEAAPFAVTAPSGSYVNDSAVR